MKTKLIVSIVAFAALTATVVIATRGSLPETSRIRVEVKDCKYTVEGSLKVEKDQNVSLAAVSDIAGEFHIHGYDLLKEVKPGEEVVFNFRAVQSGVFDIGHHSCDNDDHPMLLVLNEDGSEPDVKAHEESGEHKEEVPHNEQPAPSNEKPAVDEHGHEDPH
jgi:hypothetical protein